MAGEDSRNKSFVHGSPEPAEEDPEVDRDLLILEPAIPSQNSPTVAHWSKVSSGSPILLGDEPTREAVKQDLVRAVRHELGRFALSGHVQLKGTTLWLDTPRGRVSEDARLEIVRWEQQDARLREREATGIARRLAGKIPTSLTPPPRRRLHLDVSTLTLLALAAGLIAAVVYYSRLDQPNTSKRDGAAAHNARGQAAAAPSRPRAQTVCEATRARVLRGGLVSMADAEGWIVELALLGAPGGSALTQHLALAHYFGPVAAGRAEYKWAEEPTLVMGGAPQPPVVIKELTLATSPQPTPGLVFSFDGSFVESYFDELNRGKFYHLAHSIAQNFSADYAALYARCSHDEIHSLGSWFMGKDGQGAATSLLYFLGTYSAPRHIAPLHYRSPTADSIDRSLALSSIIRGTAHIDRGALSTLVGSEGGMAVGDGAHAVVISFPFRDGNRASRVSRTIARVTSMSE